MVDDTGRITNYNERQEHEVAMIMGQTTTVVCNTCAVAERCEEFKENAVCAFDDYFSGLSSRSIENLIPSMEMLADLQSKRAMRGAFMEAGNMAEHSIPMSHDRLRSLPRLACVCTN